MMIEEKSAGTIIYREEERGKYFLLLHYPSGHWDYVKGKMEENETTHETTKREAKEETGISDLEFVNNFEEKIEYNFRYDGKLIHKQVIFFLAKTNTKEISISHEHLDYIWLEFDDALKKITYQNAKRILTKAKNLLESL